MRYKETGNLHMDFHRTMNATISYLRRRYGMKFLDETFKLTALDVYRSIHEDMLKGSIEQIVRHWEYFFSREGGDFTIERHGDRVKMTVRRCPAIYYLKKKGIKPDPAFCRQTIVVNTALAEKTPFCIETEITGDGCCVQSIRRRDK